MLKLSKIIGLVAVSALSLKINKNHRLVDKLIKKEFVSVAKMAQVKIDHNQKLILGIRKINSIREKKERKMLINQPLSSFLNLSCTQSRFFSNQGKKDEKNWLPIPVVKEGERGSIYYCLTTKKGNHFPSITILENNEEKDYILPNWYQNWVLLNWAINEESFPSWIEFGRLEDGNYYAEFLGEIKEYIKPETKEEKEMVKKLAEKWLEITKKFKL